MVNKTIYSMYVNKDNEPITTDFILTNENGVMVQGKAEIKKHSDMIDLTIETAAMKITGNDINNNIIIINYEQIPKYFSCELTNFPLEDRIYILKEEKISIKIPKVRIYGDFTIKMADDNLGLRCSILPLCSFGEKKLADIIIN